MEEKSGTDPDGFTHEHLSRVTLLLASYFSIMVADLLDYTPRPPAFLEKF
jgi:hypothetical protein